MVLCALFRSIHVGIGEEEEVPSRTPASNTARTRPRRSYSLSDTGQEDQHQPNFQQFLKLPAGRGARRVTLEEKIKQDQEIAREEGTQITLSYAS